MDCIAFTRNGEYEDGHDRRYDDNHSKP